jgi:hypothetical protein
MMLKISVFLSGLSLLFFISAGLKLEINNCRALEVQFDKGTSIFADKYCGNSARVSIVSGSEVPGLNGLFESYGRSEGARRFERGKE